MREGWVETTLGEVADIQIGPAFKSDVFRTAESGTRLLRGLNVGPGYTRWGEACYWPESHALGYEKYLLSQEDICLAMDATFTSAGIIRAVMMASSDLPCYLVQRVLRLRATGESLQDFLWLIVGSSTFREHLTDRQTGAFAPHVSGKDISSYSFYLPPLAEQRRIVDLIGAVDAYVEACDTRVEDGKQARAALLAELLGAGGDDWVETTLGEVVDILDRLRKPISSTEREKRPGAVPYYGATGQAGWIDEPIFDETLVLLGEDAVAFDDPKASKAYLVEGPSWVNNHAHVLRARQGCVLPRFLMHSLNAVDYTDYASFGTRSKLTQGSMSGITFPLPPLAEQQRIVDIIGDLDEANAAAAHTAATAREVRAGLLSELLSGEHEVPESYDDVLEAV